MSLPTIESTVNNSPGIKFKIQPLGFLNPEMSVSDPVRPMLNVGTRFDIVSGSPIRGRYGETIINGGMPTILGVVGLGNMFKTTVGRYMVLSSFSRFVEYGSTYQSYDTEQNIHQDHQHQFTQTFDIFKGHNIIKMGLWKFTDKGIYSGDQYFDFRKDFLNNKVKEGKKASTLQNTPFLNLDGNGYMRMIIPTFSDVDSFTEFSTQDVLKMQEDATLGDSSGNMINMREGLQKNRFIREIVPLADTSKHYMLLVAHLGMEFAMDPRNPPPRKLHYLKNGLKIKGAPEKFTFATHLCWATISAVPLINRGKGGPEYPKSGKGFVKNDTDLNEVTLRIIRNKNGPTGGQISVIVSQSEGVLPAETDFHYIKENGQFGLVGNDRNYVCALAPEISLSRTTIRDKIAEHPKLVRALQICADIHQISELWTQYSEIICKPEELYQDLLDLGYDWEELLKTRSWWTFDNDKHEIPFLTTPDFLKMRLKVKNPDLVYIPYWMKKPPEKALKAYEQLMGVPYKLTKRF